MQDTHRLRHRDAALELYQQLNQLLASDWALREEYALYRHRLQIHLQLLAEDETTLFENIATPAELYVQLAIYLQQTSAMGNALIVRFLSKADFQAALILALKDYPHADNANFLLNHYYTDPTIRVAILQLWQQTHGEVPQQILQQALKSYDPKLRRIALQIMSEQNHVGLKQFRSFYQDVALDCQLMACLAGAERGDALAFELLVQLSEQDLTKTQQQELMQCLALSGDEKYLKYIVEYAQQFPKPGWSYVAMLGSKQALSQLLTAMNKIEHLEHAAQAWLLLTGHRLMNKPHLQVLDQQNVVSQSHNSVANKQDAVGWWEQAGCEWQDNQRYVWGKPYNKHYIEQLQQHYVGRWFTNFKRIENFQQVERVHDRVA